MKRFYFSWLAPLYKRVPFARFLLWQSQFLTELGASKLAIELIADFAKEITFKREGAVWTVDVRDKLMAMRLWLEPEFAANERAVLAWAHTYERLPRCTTILEIGANIGSSTIPFLQETSCRVVAIEPVPRNLALLEKNLKQNGFANRVIVIQRAIADHAETLGMIVTLHNFAGSEIARQPITRPEAIFRQPCETINVQATRLDDLVQSQQIAPRDVVFVWCDVQGSEGAVIRTGAPLWQAGVPLWAEIAPKLISRQDNLKRFLADTARFFDSYVSLKNLKTQGALASPQPIASFNKFVARLGKAQTDVLLLPRGALD